MRRAVLLLALAACAPDAPVQRPSPDLVVLAVAAADEWSAVTLPGHQIQCVDYRCTIAGAEWELVEEPGPPCCLPSVGSTLPGARRIAIASGLTPRAWYRTIKHELGHALGLCADYQCCADPPECTDTAHTVEGVMRGAPDVTFTPDVLAECRRVGVCPWD